MFKISTFNTDSSLSSSTSSFCPSSSSSTISSTSSNETERSLSADNIRYILYMTVARDLVCASDAAKKAFDGDSIFKPYFLSAWQNYVDAIAQAVTAKKEMNQATMNDSERAQATRSIENYIRLGFCGMSRLSVKAVKNVSRDDTTLNVMHKLEYPT